MIKTRLIMGMPVTVEVIGTYANRAFIDQVFDYFNYVDKKYSTYKPESEISQINLGLPRGRWSKEMTQVLDLCELTKRQTLGFFDIKRHGQLDPSGLVKGWAISNAAARLKSQGVKNFYIDAGGDIQAQGHNSKGCPWLIGIRNPFDRHEIIKTIQISDGAVATSGTAVRGQHIYNPHAPSTKLVDVVSLTVIGKDIYDVDRFATAAFAMGPGGINFIEALPGLEAYMVTVDQIATMTSGFERYVVQYAPMA